LSDDSPPKKGASKSTPEGTKVSPENPDEEDFHELSEPVYETPFETPSETIESFDTLDDIIRLDQNEQSVPSFQSVDMPDELSAELNDELSTRHPEQNQQFLPEFSGSVSKTLPRQEPASRTINAIKNYSESLNAEAPASAQLPFTLRIEGKLTPQEAEKLLDVLSREKMDIREVDIEPQLEAGRILIPRISEYAGVMLIQALRGVRAKIYFQPSDANEPDTYSDPSAPDNFNSSFDAAEAPPNAEMLPVTRGDDLPQLGILQVIETLVVSGMLSTRSVEASNSSEFTALTEALLRELKFKAFRRGARGITHLSVQLTPLTLPTDYRVTVSGTAVS
jgi:hypothetical protein